MKSPQKKRRVRGQVAVEYILVTVAIVGFAAAIYVALKRYLPKPLMTVKRSLEGDADPRGKSAGSGEKSYDYYYKNVEFKAK